MKILHITPYITNNQHTAFLRNQTGFGYMVHDIAEYVGKVENVDLFAVMCLTPPMEMNSFSVVGRSWWKVVSNLSIMAIVDGISFLKKYKLPVSERLRAFYIFLAMGQISRIVKNYDLVHIHGCSALSDAAIKVCKRKNVPFLVTLHGLNSFSEDIKLHPSLKQYERDFLKEAAINHYPVSFISTGNKRMAADSTEVNVDSFHVVCNGCDVTRKPVYDDIRKTYNLKQDDYIFAFVGNISQNKNQNQVVRAWSLLPEEDRQHCKVLFVGRYKEDDEVVKFIQEKKTQDSLILCGMQPKEMVASFYQVADATILTSITEGFGLSIIEGFVYGKPNVTFADLPATQDLYDECAMVLSENRSDEALSDAMHKVMRSTFDKEKIIAHAQQFSFEKMAKKYHNLYKQIVK